VDVADVERALEATREVGSAVGLAIDEATVIRNSNKLALRLQFPSGETAGSALLSALRAGPPWPTLDAVMKD
jgi:hypothetical protein